jgi:hypothetical protein
MSFDDVRRRQALEHLFYCALTSGENPMHAADAREVLAELLDRDEVAAAWSAAMRRMAARG